MFLVHFLTSVFAVAENGSAEETSNTVLKSFQLYHSVQPNKFTPRGKINLMKDSEGSLEARFEEDGENTLVDDFFKGLDDIISRNGFYKIKVEDSESGKSVITSAPGCDVKRANFR